MCSFCSQAAFQTGNFSAQAAGQSSNAAITYITETADAAAGTNTTYTMGVGDFFIGTASSDNIGNYNDDWIAVTLQAGTTYTITMNSFGVLSNGLTDPYLGLMNASGNFISGGSGDVGPGNYEQITYTVATTGTYYLAAGANTGPNAGGYMLTVTQGSKASFDHLMGAATLYNPDASWSATAATGANVTYAFAGTGVAKDASGLIKPFEVLSAAQVVATQQALALFSDVSGLTFTQVNPGGTSENATILLNGYTSTTDGSGAYAYYPGNPAAGDIAGNVSLNNTYVSQSSLPFGSYSFYTIMHEIGHAVGLAHPGDYNAAPGVDITYANSAQFIQDSQQYTVMSYFDESAIGASFGGYAGTLMMYDIWALQQLYGVNNATRSGNTIYGFNSNAGSVYDFSISAGRGVCIWDGAGTDTIDVSGWTMNQQISLVDGTFSNVGGLVGNLSIAVGALIENAVGGSGIDTITGNAVDNSLYGNGGNDTLNGGGGNDNLFGGAGTDVLNGGADFDFARYDQASSGVYARLDGVADSFGEGAGDVFISIEGLIGSNFNDIFVGSNTNGDGLYGLGGADLLYGLGGNDTLDGGAGNDNLFGGTGTDVLNGGADFDFARYDQASSGVYARLDGVADSFGEGAGDVFISIEGLIGSNFNDIFVGSNTNGDGLYGLGGADLLYGLGGNDTLEGGAGNDILFGGTGTDVFVFNTFLNATTNVDMIMDFQVNLDDIVLSQAIFTGVGITLNETEFQVGSADSSTDRILYDNIRGQLYYDADGNGSGLAILFANITAGTVLTTSDFIMAA